MISIFLVLPELPQSTPHEQSLISNARDILQNNLSGLEMEFTNNVLEAINQNMK